MKIIENFLDDEYTGINELFGETNEIDSREVWSIGSTRLSCDDCAAVIDILKREGHNWKVCGRHGKEYRGWLIPNFMKGREEEIREWKEENPAEERILETTSEISKKEN